MILQDKLYRLIFFLLFFNNIVYGQNFLEISSIDSLYIENYDTTKITKLIIEDTSIISFPEKLLKFNRLKQIEFRQCPKLKIDSTLYKVLAKYGNLSEISFVRGIIYLEGINQISALRLLGAKKSKIIFPKEIIFKNYSNISTYYLDKCILSNNQIEVLSSNNFIRYVFIAYEHPQQFPYVLSRMKNLEQLVILNIQNKKKYNLEGFKNLKTSTLIFSKNKKFVPIVNFQDNKKVEVTVLTIKTKE